MGRRRSRQAVPRGDGLGNDLTSDGGLQPVLGRQCGKQRHGDSETSHDDNPLCSADGSAVLGMEMRTERPTLL